MRLRSVFNSAEAVIARTSELFSGVAILSLVAMMMLTVSDVTLRYFFNRPITASTEFTEYLMLGTGFLGLAWCATQGKHIRVELVINRFPSRARAIADSVNALLMLGMSVVVARQSIMESIAARQLRAESIITYIPLYPFYWIVSLGFFLIALVMISSLAHSLFRVVKP